MLEIRRVLGLNGKLIGRLNSVNDSNFGAGEGQEIEPGLFLVKRGTGTQQKRFFSEDDVRKLFADWQINYLIESRFEYYGNEKVAWEFCVSYGASD